MKQVELIVMKLASKDLNDMELGPSNEMEDYLMKPIVQNYLLPLIIRIILII